MDQPSKKYERTTAEQLCHFVKFCENHPELMAGKTNPTTINLQDLWIQLGNELNAIRGPTRTWSKWKETLGFWRSQLRCRARKRKADQMVTGGGPYSGGISSFEERALTVFGAAAVTGEEAVPTIGFRPIVLLDNSSAQSSPNMGTLSPTLNTHSPTLNTPSPTMGTPSPTFDMPSPTASTSSSTPRVNRRSKADLLEMMFSSMERREKREEQLAKGLQDLAKAVSDMAKAIAEK